MPLPHTSVVNSLIETYLQIRKSSWKLSSDDYAINPKQFAEHIQKKLVACEGLLLQTETQPSAVQWVEYLKQISQAIRPEAEENEYKRSGISGIIAKLTFYDRPLFLETLAAIRSYIVKELRSTPTANRLLKAKIDLLLSQQSACVSDMARQQENGDVSKANEEKLKEINEALSDLAANDEQANQPYYFKPNFHIEFYNDVIKVRDKQVKPLHEKSFDDFVGNVVSNMRPPQLTVKLLIHSKEVQLAAGYQNIQQTARIISSLDKSGGKLIVSPTTDPTPAEAASQIANGLASNNGFYNQKSGRKKRRTEIEALQPLLPLSPQFK